MRSLMVMDPLDRIHVSGDSTYVVMLELDRRNTPCWMCTPGQLYARDGRCYAAATRVRALPEAPWFEVAETVDLELGAFDVVWMRKDPPFDMSYILATYLLDMAPPSTLVVNDPIGLKLFNEKLWAMQFPELHPPTLLTGDPRRLRAFVDELDGRAVLKPWDGNGGRGVLVTDAADRNLNSMIELMTADGAFVIAQPYLEEADAGDKRILLFDGEPVAAMLRIPTAKDYRGNMHVGATVEACDLDARDQHICDVLGPHLQRHGQVFVGIDVIGGLLTEINVTSPTGIREIFTLTGQRLERNLVDRVWQRAERKSVEGQG